MKERTEGRELNKQLKEYTIGELITLYNQLEKDRAKYKREKEAFINANANYSLGYQSEQLDRLNSLIDKLSEDMRRVYRVFAYRNRL